MTLRLYDFVKGRWGEMEKEEPTDYCFQITVNCLLSIGNWKALSLSKGAI